MAHAFQIRKEYFVLGQNFRYLKKIPNIPKLEKSSHFLKKKKNRKNEIKI